MKKEKYSKYILFIKIVSLLITAVVIRVYISQYHRVISGDGAAYAVAAENLISGKGYTSIEGRPELHYPPLYPVLIGFSYLFFRDSEVAAKFVSLIFGSVLVIPAYFFAREMYNEKVAWLCGLLIVFYPILIDFSTTVYAEALYLFLLMCYFFTSWKALNLRSNRLFIVSGTLTGLLYLTRHEGAIYACITIFLVIIKILYCKSRGIINETWKWMIQIFLLVISFTLIAFPYIIFLHENTGVWAIEGVSCVNTIIGEFVEQGKNYDEVAYGILEDGTPTGPLLNVNEFIAKNIGKTSLVKYSIEHPREIFVRYIKNLWGEYKILTTEVFLIPVLFLTGIGLFGTFWNKERLKKELFLIIMFSPPVLTIPLFYTKSRFFVTLIPLGLMWAANGIVEMREWFDRTVNNFDIKNIERWQLLFSYVTLAIVLILFLPKILEPIKADPMREEIEEKEAGLWLRENSKQGAVIMARFTIASYYAQGKWVALPYGNYVSVLKFARNNNVNYILFDNRTAGMRPQLAFLLNEKNTPSDLQLVYKWDKKPGYELRLYELKC
jgi:4-amino-4-deoxy-L-arabinose transferase-like glycosyltransferase